MSSDEALALAWLPLGPIALAVEAHHVWRIAGPEESPDAAIDLVAPLGLEGPPASAVRHLVGLRHTSGVHWVVAAEGVSIRHDDAFRRLAVPHLVADHLRDLGIVGLVEHDGLLGYVMDPAALVAATRGEGR